MLAEKNCVVPEITVLISGGLDSTACLGFYLAQGVSVKAMHFDYGQDARLQELGAARKVADYYKIGLNYRRLSNARSKDVGEIFGRNAFLLFGGLLELDSNSGVIAIGVHAGSRYFDCGEEFIGSIQRLFDGYGSGRLKVAAPFLKWTKPEIWDYCLHANVPVHLTYSCERGGIEPCGSCLSCMDLEALHAGKAR